MSTVTTQTPETVQAPTANRLRQILSSDRPYTVFLALVALIIFLSLRSAVFFSTAGTTVGTTIGTRRSRVLRSLTAAAAVAVLRTASTSSSSMT